MKKAVMSYVRKDIVEAVQKLGYDTIESTPLGGTSSPEGSHADMQALTLPQGDIFLIRDNDGLNSTIARLFPDRNIICTNESISEFKYPECVKLNAAVVGKRVIANIKYIDKAVTSRLSELGYELINVKQGYAKCSVCVVSDSAIITSDEGIARSLKRYDIDVLKISPGHIGLCGSYGGFIGGAAFLADKELLAFTGDIMKHPDGESIEEFCRSHSVDTVSLSDENIFDIGGVVAI